MKRVRPFVVPLAMLAGVLLFAYPAGCWWIDGITGNVGVEGNPMPIANVFGALQQAQQRGTRGQGGYRWHSNATGAYGGSELGCTWLSVPGSGTVTTACD